MSKDDALFALGMSPPPALYYAIEVLPGLKSLTRVQGRYEEAFKAIGDGSPRLSRAEFLRFAKRCVVAMTTDETYGAVDEGSLTVGSFLRPPPESAPEGHAAAALGPPEPYDTLVSARVMSRAKNRLRTDKALQKIFLLLDKRKDGVLQKREILVSLSGHGNKKVASLLSYFEPLKALLRPATYAEALESMSNQVDGKVTFDEFRAFCNAVVEEADERSSSRGGSVDGDEPLDSSRISARAEFDMSRDKTLRSLFRTLGGGAEAPMTKRHVLKSLQADPAVGSMLSKEPSLTALARPQTFGATFDSLAVSGKDGVSVNWLEFRAFCTSVVDEEDSAAAVTSYMV